MARQDKRAKPNRASVEGVRIIGGRFRGRQLTYDGQPLTRPMKDRTREAVFNLLGPAVEGKHAIDLFAGTGALGLEALSRGAERVTLIERHFPTARVLRHNVQLLDPPNQVNVITSDTFFWARKVAATTADLRDLPLIVFCSPPYDLYVERTDEVLKLIQSLFQQALPGSMFVVEADRRFDVDLLPAAAWDIRHYPPAVVALAEIQRDSAP